MAETASRRESIETKSETSPEKLASDAVAALEAKDKNSKKWVDWKDLQEAGLKGLEVTGKATVATGKGVGLLGLVSGYGILRLALKAIEVSANVLEHVAKNMTNIEDPKFWSGLVDSSVKSFKSDKKSDK